MAKIMCIMQVQKISSPGERHDAAADQRSRCEWRA